MKRTKNLLRHPVRAIREPFGTAGLVIAMIALIAALGGGAYAASGALTGKQKKEVEKIAKQFAGKPGEKGAAGPAGPAGGAGAKGDAGAAGTKGDPGSSGGAGKSVTVTETSCGGLGGAEVKQEGSASGVEVCNGEEGSPGNPGPPGPTGNPWTAGGTLPVGSEETGFWTIQGQAGKTSFAPISFPIQMPAPLKAAQTFYGTGSEFELTETEFTKHCPGVNSTQPKVANAGNLCIYFDPNSESGSGTFEGVFRNVGEVSGGTTRAGGALQFSFLEDGWVSGSFAVKGCVTVVIEGSTFCS